MGGDTGVPPMTRLRGQPSARGAGHRREQTQLLAAMLQAMWSKSLLGEAWLSHNLRSGCWHHGWGLLGQCAPVLVVLAVGRSLRYGPGWRFKKFIILVGHGHGGECSQGSGNPRTASPPVLLSSQGRGNPRTASKITKHSGTREPENRLLPSVFKRSGMREPKNRQ